MSTYIKKALIVEGATFGIPAPAEIKAKLAYDSNWAQRGLLAVYNEQMSDEQAAKKTKHLNLVGFSKFDAEFLSSMAQQLKRKRALSPKQMMWVHRKMPKYANQLFLLSLTARRAKNV